MFAPKCNLQRRSFNVALECCFMCVNQTVQEVVTTIYSLGQRIWQPMLIVHKLSQRCSFQAKSDPSVSTEAWWLQHVITRDVNLRRRSFNIAHECLRVCVCANKPSWLNRTVQKVVTAIYSLAELIPACIWQPTLFVHAVSQRCFFQSETVQIDCSVSLSSHGQLCLCSWTASRTSNASRSLVGWSSSSACWTSSQTGFGKT